MTRFTPLAVLALSLSACTSAAPPMTDPLPPPTASTPDPDASPCNAEAAKADAIGRIADEATLARARSQAGVKFTRVIKPGMMVTMEFNPDRLNVDVDDNNRITNVRCG